MSVPFDTNLIPQNGYKRFSFTYLYERFHKSLESPVATCGDILTGSLQHRYEVRLFLDQGTVLTPPINSPIQSLWKVFFNVPKESEI